MASVLRASKQSPAQGLPTRDGAFRQVDLRPDMALVMHEAHPYVRRLADGGFLVVYSLWSACGSCGAEVLKY